MVTFNHREHKSSSLIYFRNFLGNRLQVQSEILPICSVIPCAIAHAIAASDHHRHISLTLFQTSESSALAHIQWNGLHDKWIAKTG